MQDKVYGMLGLSAKAGAAASGAFAVEQAVKSCKAYLLVMAGDASDSTKHDYEGLCAGYGVPLVYYGTKDELGAAIGRNERAAVAITNESLAANIQSRISGSEGR